MNMTTEATRMALSSIVDELTEKRTRIREAGNAQAAAQLEKTIVRLKQYIAQKQADGSL